MGKSRWFPIVLTCLMLCLARRANAYSEQTCYWTVLNVLYVKVTDDFGAVLSEKQVDYWGWLCPDYTEYDWSQYPHPPGYTGPPDVPPPIQPPTPQPPPPAPPPNPECSFAQCSRNCNLHYLADAGVEVTATGIIQRYIEGFDCGVYCQESARMNWEACKAECIESCNLP